MAITIVNGNRGTATEKTDDTTLSITPLANFTTGNYALAAIIVDNQTTSEGETNEITCADSAGNSYFKLREQTEANTAADTGCTIALFLSCVTKGLTTGNTVNFTLTAGGSSAKGAGLAELSVASNKILTLSVGSVQAANAAASTSYSLTNSSLANVAGLYIGMAGAEEENDTAVTLDAAYTALAFGSIGSGTGGIATSNVRARVGTLANTSTGDTFNASALTSCDRATILVRLQEDDILPGTRQINKYYLQAIQSNIW